MRLVSLKTSGGEAAGILIPEGVALLETVNKAFGMQYPTGLPALIQSGLLPELTGWYNGGGRERIAALDTLVLPAEADLAPLYRRPFRLLSVGSVGRSPRAVSTESGWPATIIGAEDEIRLPPYCEGVTAQSELAVVLGKACRDCKPGDWLDAVAGFTGAISVTAGEVPCDAFGASARAGGFNGFFSFGPALVTPDELPDIGGLHVATMCNGAAHAERLVSDMALSPEAFVSFCAKAAPWRPGDVLCTGTPGAVPIHWGDIVACRIDGLDTLENPVVDLRP